MARGDWAWLVFGAAGVLAGLVLVGGSALGWWSM
jgi:hypothetical protein